MDEASRRGRAKHRTSEEHRLERNRLKGTAGNEINAILAAAAMNFQKLLRAFWRIFLFCLIHVWNEMLTFNLLENHFFRIDLFIVPQRDSIVPKHPISLLELTAVMARSEFVSHADSCVICTGK